MRALVFLAAFCLACATAFPQVAPTPSAVCSIPLLRFAAPDIDPLIVKKMPPVSDRTSQARLPAPPCEEPAARQPALAQLLGGQRDRLVFAMKKFVSGRKSAAVVEKSDPVPYVLAPLPSGPGESLKP